MEKSWNCVEDRHLTVLKTSVQGCNLYAYCQNNPMGYYNPSGYKAKLICEKKYNELLKKEKTNRKNR